MKRRILIITILVIVVIAGALAIWFGVIQRGVLPQVWSQRSPEGESYEFKVNNLIPRRTLETGFLWGLDAVTVTGPDGTVYALEKDFNINTYSGEVTRRWVLYGPMGAGLPESGKYVFTYYKDGSAVFSQTVKYTAAGISYPTGVTWERDGADLKVVWDPPPDVGRTMWYKVIVWNEYGTPDLFISDVFKWDAASAVMKDVPLIDGGNYGMNVALFFFNGYAYSDYIPITW